MVDRIDLVDRHTGTTATPVHAPSPRAIRTTGDGAFFAKAGITSVHRWQPEPLRLTWSLDLGPSRDAPYAAIEVADGQTHVVTAIADGATLVAFDVSERDGPARRSGPSCAGAHPSRHLGERTGWAGEQVHATVIDGQQQQLLIGIPGANPTDTSFTVSADPVDTTGEARFSHTFDDWQQELVVDRAGHTADGFPPHWVVAAEFPQPGCWELRIAGDQVDDTAIIPVSAARDVNG